MWARARRAFTRFWALRCTAGASLPPTSTGKVPLDFPKLHGGTEHFSGVCCREALESARENVVRNRLQGTVALKLVEKGDYSGNPVPADIINWDA
jgi:hypothetical protein